MKLTAKLTAADVIVRIIFGIVWAFPLWGLDYLLDRLDASRHWSVAAGSVLGAFLLAVFYRPAERKNE